MEQQTKKKEELPRDEAHVQMQLAVVQGVVEQLLAVTQDQLAGKVCASVEKDRVTEPKDALEAPVVQSSAVGDPVTVAGTVGVESGPQMRAKGPI